MVPGRKGEGHARQREACTAAMRNGKEYLFPETTKFSVVRV
jgi:hypothetical protein